MDFRGKVGLITGAASGIGRATALGFAQRGGSVVVADIHEANATAVAKEITDTGGNAIPVVADVTNKTDLDAMLAHTVESFGRLDFLHNNAFGLGNPGGTNNLAARTADLDDSIWDNTSGARRPRTPQLNLFGS